LGLAHLDDRIVRYRERGGVEFANRLQVLRVWEPAGDGSRDRLDRHDRDIWLRLL